MPNYERAALCGLQVGADVEGAVCVRRVSPGTTKDEKAYLTIEVGNATGAASGKVWSEQLEAWQTIRAGQPVRIAARVKPGFRGGPPELAFLDVELLAPDHEIALELNPVCPVPLDRLEERFRHLVSCLSPKGQLLLDIVLDYVGRDLYWTAPAAKSVHHAYVRGLVEHSIEVAEIALALAQASPAAEHLDYDALLVGALTHDTGKTREYVWVGEPIDLSRRGRLSYHTVSGATLVAVAVALSAERLAAAGVHELAVDHLLHVVCSHHGQPDWGSPVEPHSLEAMFIHIADLASARGRSMLDELTSKALGPDGWAVPTGWGRKPVFSLRAALASAATGPHDDHCDGAVPEVSPEDGAPEDLPGRIIAFLRVLPDAAPSIPLS